MLVTRDEIVSKINEFDINKKVISIILYIFLKSLINKKLKREGMIKNERKKNY